jgi:hypothetical protein
MTVHQQISKAVMAHGAWKSQLHDAIARGASDANVTNVRLDNQCEFGKWMYGKDLSDQDKRSPLYAQCRTLHRQFHLAAAKVLNLALAAKKEEALRAMAVPDGEFAISSSALTKAMMDWDREVPH